MKVKYNNNNKNYKKLIRLFWNNPATTKTQAATEWKLLDHQCQCFRSKFEGVMVRLSN